MKLITASAYAGITWYNYALQQNTPYIYEHDFCPLSGRHISKKKVKNLKKKNFKKKKNKKCVLCVGGIKTKQA